MRKFYFLLVCTASMLFAKAQTSLIAGNTVIADNTIVKRCATVEAVAEARRNNPGAETDAQFEVWMNNTLQQRHNAQANPFARLTVLNYNLPVIFHIISNGETVGTLNNISAALITQQLLQINKDYANQSGSPYAVSSNTGLQFFLAQKDQSNNTLAEPGIDRINRTTYGWTDPTAGWTTTYITNTVKPASIWDPTRYLNVWVVPLMPGTVSGTEILGFATFPASSGLSGLNETETNSIAGIVIKAATVGSIFQPAACANANSKGKTLSHELGHFFGLRHIWGDATCATDYVNDTPVHETSNSGVPTHPKPNNCGTTDEMFENYMDYSDDIVTNTFTVNQVDRIQTVMLNSPRRVSLPTSTVGFVPVTGTNRISFNDCTGAMTLSEAGTTGTTSRYRDLNLYLIVEDKATAAATVTLNTSGTAVSGTTYTLLTPSVLTFAAGDAAKPVTIRILDNVAVDGDKTIVLSFTISGTGVTAGTIAQTETITIRDDDNFPTSQNPITLVNESFEGSVPGWATVNFVASPVNVWTVSANGNAGGSGACAHITNDNTLRPNTYTKTTAATVGIRTPLISAIGMQNLTVSFNYRVWGEVSGSTAVDYGRIYSTTPTSGGTYSSVATTGTGPYAGSTDSVTAVANFTMPANFNSTDFYLAMLWFNNASGGNNPPMNIDNFVVKGDGVPVETAVSSSYSFNVSSALAVHNFRSTNNKSIARLSALNANLTNVTVAVTEAGNDRPGFTANGTTYLRTRKVISVNPSPNNTTVQYTIKLYYTSAELAAWGGSLTNLKMMKVNSGVSLSSPLNNSNAVIVTPSLVEDSIASRGYAAFTATFTGFSQFVLVESNAIVPLRWLSFTGILDKSQVKLNWKTADEINNKGFDIERSTDAVSFEKIGWVDASSTNSYELFDTKIVKGNTYYYRLKQVDKDGLYTYSPVIRINYSGNNTISIFPNPVKNNLVIQQSGTGRTSVVITDLTGKTVYSTEFAAGSLHINAQSWSKGLYLVRVFKDEEVSSFKIIKQ